MFRHLTRSLKFQFGAAMLSVVFLLAGATMHTFMALQKQQSTFIITNLAGRMQLTAEQLATQGMNYKSNAPKDYPTYSRDLRLYYRDLQGHVGTFDQIADSFMHGEFKPDLTGLAKTLKPSLGPRVKNAIKMVGDTWIAYRDPLYSALGPSPDMPELEAAADYVIANHLTLEKATNELAENLRAWADKETADVNTVNRIVLTAAALISLAIIFGFYRNVLRPLSLAAEGARQIARGDFSHLVETSGHSEIAELTGAFNHLSQRMRTLFRLIARVQEGSDLNETLSFVSREFRDLLRIDWVGVVFATADGTAARLDTSYLDGEQEIAARQVYPLEGTLLQQAMDEARLVHTPDISANAGNDPAQAFPSMLRTRGMQDAVFLPLSLLSPSPGVLVFANRERKAYTGEHLELLTNIAHLITHSFAKTARLAENARLAAIGEFASGIAHEVRNPLATISIALDYLDTQTLPGSGNRRVDLARKEADRMAGLLEDILLYAKPLSLDLRPVELKLALESFLEDHRDLFNQRQQQTIFSDAPRTRILGDQDRLTQVFLNLARNAAEAAPQGGLIQWALEDAPDKGALTLTVSNGGAPIAAERLAQVIRPFVTTKAAGAGLGLSIVKRIVEAHGGELSIESSIEEGTRVRIVLPRLS